MKALLAIALVCTAAGCTVVPVEPTPIKPTRHVITDGCATALGVVGRVACATALGIAPGGTELLDGIDGRRQWLAERAGAARDRAAAADLEHRRMAFCMANPTYGPCAGIVEHALALSSRHANTSTSGNTGDGAQEDVAPSPEAVDLRQTIKDAESRNGPLLRVSANGHVCWGHSVVQNGDRARFANRTLTVEECELVLDQDIESAQIRAKRYLSCETPACIEACYVWGCAQWGAVSEAAVALRGITGPKRARAQRLSAAL